METRRARGGNSRTALKFIARHGSDEIEVEVEYAAGDYRVRLGDRWFVVDMVNAGPYVRSLRLEDGKQLSLIHHRSGNAHEISLDDATIRVEITDPLSLKRMRTEDSMGAAGTLTAMMPGRIVRVSVTKGQQVRKGEGLLVLEAMKMENEIQAPADGIVDSVFVEAGQTVENGAELVHIAPL